MENQQGVTKSKGTFWVKLQSISVTIVALMLSLGQWNDTKDAITSAYEGFITHWTNKVEYKQVSQLHIGQTYEYVQSIVGIPHASKLSKQNKKLVFYYYGNKKYQLTLAVMNKRLSGFSVVALQPDFFVDIPFIDKQLLQASISSYFKSPESYFSDSNNLEYYIEAHELGKNAMFYQMLLGSVNYGHFSQTETSTVIELNRQLDSGREADIRQARLLMPNYFAVSEIPATIMADGLLTKFEYQTLLKK